MYFVLSRLNEGRQGRSEELKSTSTERYFDGVQVGDYAMIWIDR
jgi:hypothetical protein